MGDACHTCKRWHAGDETARSPLWGWCEVEVMLTRWDYLCPRYKTRLPVSKSVGADTPQGEIPNAEISHAPSASARDSA